MQDGGRGCEGNRPEGRVGCCGEVRLAWRKGAGESLAKICAGKERGLREGAIEGFTVIP